MSRLSLIQGGRVDDDAPTDGRRPALHPVGQHYFRNVDGVFTCACGTTSPRIGVYVEPKKAKQASG